MIAYLAVALAAFMWGTWRFVLLYAERQVPGAFIDARVESAIVMLVITIFGFALLTFEKRDHEPRRAIHWLGVAWLGIADALNVVLLFAAYAHTTVAIAVTTHYLAPIFVAAVASRVLGEAPHPSTWFAIAFGFLGLALLLRPWSGDLGAHDWLGAAAGAGSAVFYASNVIVNKKLVGKFTAVELMAFHGVVATPFLFALAPLSRFAALNARATLVLVVGGIGPGALGGVLFIWALRRIRAARASTITLLEPLVAVSIAVALGERLAPISWLGASLILVCAGSVVRRS